MFLMFKKFTSPSFAITLLILCVAAYVSSGFAVISFLDIIELKTIDLRFKARGETVPGSPVVLAVVDEKSLKREGKWIWPRTKIADLINCLSEAGARVIAFDIVFSEADNSGVILLNNVHQAIERCDIHNPDLNNHLSQLAMDLDNDRILADAIANSRADVVLGNFFHIKPQEALHLSADMIAVQTANISGAVYQCVQYTSEKAYRDADFLEVFAPEANISMIAASSSSSGYFNMISDKDGVIRWAPGIFKFRDNLYAHLSLKALAAYLDCPLCVFVGELGVTGIQIGDLAVPTDELGRIMVNYRGGPKTFTHISVADILDKRVDTLEIKDKLVLVGVTAVGVYDLRVTPFDTDFSGVEINANLIDSIMAGDFLYQPAKVKIYDAMAILFLGGLLGWLLPKVRVIPGAIGTLGLVAGYVFFCVYLFCAGGIVLNMVYPVITLVLIYLTISIYRYFTEERQKRFIKNAFSTYLSPAVVDQLIKSPEKLVLGGEERQITAFFSDIAGFTSISEKLSPESLVELLNEFLTEMSDIILIHKGMVDKYEGDAIIAMFGAPNALENHSKAACAASIDMQARLAVLREKWESEKNLIIRMRIGLCSGPAVVGNMGSKNRMDYTMMGDTVNTAARLEGVNKIYDTFTLISQTTYEGAKDLITARELDAIKVVGKTVPVKIYELVGYKDEVDEKMMQTIGFYEQGLAAYRRRQWDAAVDFFHQALKIMENDGPSKKMISRCQAYKMNPPDLDWNGAYIMSTK